MPKPPVFQEYGIAPDHIAQVCRLLELDFGVVVGVTDGGICDVKILGARRPDSDREIVVKAITLLRGGAAQLESLLAELPDAKGANA